jgi:flagellar basal body-associated protein FliL
MADQSEMNDAAEKSTGKENGEGGNKFLTAGILIAGIVINIIVAVIIINKTKPVSEEQKIAKRQADSLKQATERATTMGATTAENPIEAVVNIAGTGGERFLKAAIIFEYDDKEYPDLGEELVRRAPKFKDLLINHLSRLTLEEVNEVDAKEKIRKDLLRLVNATLPIKVGEVREVLFTTYIVQ